ncbi:PLP-dependent aminotransferase family protein [Marichromatium sp. AB32]|uniref:aminotransferase-like domain-containing protein n=1 Tax=Marichromatium sp. AB32 TaxID=2483363 RepID=UPI000F3BA8D3|nr:PLP-dependent aminotransferase family protein [Marichromatium sp. AB32]RNE93251.1 PLP-dependent aminotransferase family protein [Marichromatium sp. AB32]
MSTSYRYAEIAGALEARMRDGLYRPGERLPGVRRLAREFEVSIGTVLEALHRLEAQGRVRARARSGYYVQAPTRSAQPAISTPPPAPAPVRGQDMVLRLLQAANDPAFVQLGAAVPDPRLLPRKALARAVASAYRRYPDAAIDCAFPPGLEALRRQVARHLSAHGTPLHPDALLITSGCLEAVTLALRALTRPGDVVAVESPTYYGLLQALDALGLQALEIPTDPAQGISLEALGFALEQWSVAACIVTTNFSNPLGAVLSSARKRALSELLAAHGVALIEDDIYGDLAFSGVRPDTAKCYDREGRVIYCGSFSKTLSPGMRVGWVAPGVEFERIEFLKYATNLAAPSVLQLALAELLASGAYLRHLREVSAGFALAVGRMRHAVERHFPPGTRVTRPSGGFLLWLQLPAGIDSMALHARAHREGISIAPGPMFSASGKYRDCLRLNAAVPWTPAVERALRRLGALARELAGD